MSVNTSRIELVLVSNSDLDGVVKDLIDIIIDYGDVYIQYSYESVDSISDRTATMDLDDDILNRLGYEWCDNCESWCVDESDGTIAERYYCDDCDEIACEYCGIEGEDGRWRCAVCNETYETERENDDKRDRLYDAVTAVKRDAEKRREKKDKEEKSEIAEIAEKIPF